MSQRFLHPAAAIALATDQPLFQAPGDFPSKREIGAFLLNQISPVVFNSVSVQEMVENAPHYSTCHCYSGVLVSPMTGHRVSIQFRGSRPQVQGVKGRRTARDDKPPQTVPHSGPCQRVRMYQSTCVVGTPWTVFRIPPPISGWELERLPPTLQPGMPNQPQNKAVAIRDLARFFTNHIKKKEDLLLASGICDFQVLGSAAEESLYQHFHPASKTLSLLRWCVDKVRFNQEELQELPYVLFHKKVHPTEYVQEPRTGLVSGVLRWDDVHYEPIGFSLLFVDYLLRNQADFAQRASEALLGLTDYSFYGAVLANLSEAGFPDVTPQLLQAARAAGMVDFAFRHCMGPDTIWAKNLLLSHMISLAHVEEYMHE
ncbi:unnamed protein product [Clonostachys rosea f. rosea IK726]|uniref:Uncharacterized protein n=1 Tax=Clonostachys rosea f. rosea IK726 TaxID=1349383 RepID=A0ACA9TZL4_BIOOC|nr:unnamed protein product [Clonostachys rosea f. rosea IK726]